MACGRNFNPSVAMWWCYIAGFTCLDTFDVFAVILLVYNNARGLKIKYEKVNNMDIKGRQDKM